MKMYPIQNAKEVCSKICELHHKKSKEFEPIWEAWYNARKELNELGYAMEKIMEAERTGVVNSKTLKIIEKYLPQESSAETRV